MKIVGVFGVFYVRHSSYIRRRKKTPKYFVSENIKKSCSQKNNGKNEN
jgi:hypothetical protein